MGKGKKQIEKLRKVNERKGENECMLVPFGLLTLCLVTAGLEHIV